MQTLLCLERTRVGEKTFVAKMQTTPSSFARFLAEITQTFTKFLSYRQFSLI